MSYKYDFSKLINTTDKEEKKDENTDDTNKQVSENKNKEDTSNLKDKTLNEVITELDDLENKYKNYDYIDAPNELNLEKTEVPNKTNDELYEIAKESLLNKYSKNKNSTTETFNQKINNLISKQETEKQKAEDQKKEIDLYYNNAIDNTEEQALKRGLARSSIIINQISSLNGSKANELVTVMKTLQNNLDLNEENISTLEQEKEIALNNLDIEYAIELNNKINEVKSDYEKAKQEAIEFNNNVEKLKAEYKLDLDKQKLNKQEKLTEMKDEYKVDYLKSQIEQAKYNHLKTYFDTLDKDYAINLFLSNDKLKSILGNNYQKFYDYLKNK